MKKYLLLIPFLIPFLSFGQSTPNVFWQRYVPNTMDTATVKNGQLWLDYSTGKFRYWHGGTKHTLGAGGGGTLTGSGTTNQIAYFTGSSALGSLNTSTYPSLTELSYVKGVTSSVQTQLDTKISSAFYQTVQNSGSGLTQRSILNATNGLTAVDNTTKTDVKLGGALTANTTISGAFGLFLSIGSGTSGGLSLTPTYTTLGSGDYMLLLGGNNRTSTQTVTGTSATSYLRFGGHTLTAAANNMAHTAINFGSLTVLNGGFTGTSFTGIYYNPTITTATHYAAVFGSGNVGIGTLTPTSNLHLGRVVSTAAGSSPLKFTLGGTLMTIPEPGAVEPINDHIYWTDSGGARWRLDQQSKSYGYVFNDHFYRTSIGSNYLQIGSTATFGITSNRLSISGGINNYAESLQYEKWTDSENWELIVDDIQNTATSSTDALAVGVYTVNSAMAGSGLTGVVGFIDLSSAGTKGQLKIISNVNGTATTYETSTSNLSITNGNSITLILKRTYGFITLTAINNTTGNTVSIYETWGTTSIPEPHRVAKVRLYAYKGDQTIGGLSFKITEKQNPKFVFKGNSIQYGYGASDFDHRYINILKRSFVDDIIIQAMPGNSTNDYVKTDDETLLINPQYAVLERGINDALQGVSSATFQANLEAEIKFLESHGIVPILVTIPQATASETTLVNAYNAIINAKTAYTIIDLSSALSSGGILAPAFDYGDGVHWNDTGHETASIVIQNGIKKLSSNNFYAQVPSAGLILNRVVVSSGSALGGRSVTDYDAFKFNPSNGNLDLKVSGVGGGFNATNSNNDVAGFGVNSSSFGTYGNFTNRQMGIYSSGPGGIAISSDNATGGISFGAGSGIPERMNISSTGDVKIINLAGTGSRVLNTSATGVVSVLSSPATNGYVLSSTTAGVLSWVPNGGGGGITNSAANTEFMLSDGTNAIGSGLFGSGVSLLMGTGVSGSTRTIQADGSNSSVGLNFEVKGNAHINFGLTTRTSASTATFNNLNVAVGKASNTSSDPALLSLYRSRGTSTGSISGVSSGDYIGQLDFTTYDGVADVSGARISAFVTGSVSTGVVPSDLVFYTTATNTPIERMRINSEGRIITNAPVTTKGYTVATLPTGNIGDIAYVTDALTPAFLITIVGGGSVVSPVFFNGTNWVSF